MFNPSEMFAVATFYRSGIIKADARKTEKLSVRETDFKERVYYLRIESYRYSIS